MSSLNTSPLVKTYTLEEFWRLPDRPDSLKLELIAGVLYMTPPPEHAQDDIISRLLVLLTDHLKVTGDKGKLRVPRAAIWTSPNTHLEPDLFYASAELEARLDPAHRDTADLVVEVISSGSAVYDRNTKADTYGALAVRELWLVDQAAESVEVRYQQGDGFGKIRVFGESDKIASEVFPDINLPISKIFED